MAERKVSVRVSVNGHDVDRELDKMAVEAALVSAALRGIPNRVTVKGDSRGLDQIEQQARRAERSSSALVDTAAAIWPALIPVATLGVPAIAGLSAQFGFAVAGAGTMILAFHGMGDALKALNAYQLDPTVQNLQKAQQALDALGPSGAQFAIELQHLSPVLKQLKQDAGSGLFPGAEQGLDSLLTRLPQLQRILRTISSVEGDALAGLGQGVASPELDSFFNYLETDAKPILTDMAATVGHLASGFAHLFVDLAPQERAFSNLLANGARDFDGWANGLNQTQGFQEFIDYVDQTGPEVAQTVTAIATAFLDVAKAGAPLSGVTLHALADLADIIDRIARSPLGTPLIALAGGLALVNRALSVQAFAKNSLLADLLYGKVGASGTRSGTAIDRIRGSVTGLVSDLRTARSLPKITERFGLPTEAELNAQAAAAGRLRGQLGTLARGGALVGGLALATSGYAQKAGLANTVTFALAGSLAGPLGAALGGTVGFLKDIHDDGQQVVETFHDLDAAANSGNIDDLASALARAKAQMQDLSSNSGVLDTISGALGSGELQSILKGPDLAGNFSNPLIDDQAKIDAAQTKLANLTSTYRGLAQLIGQPLPADASTQDILNFAAKVDPALKATGVSVKELANGSFSSLQKAASGVQAYLAQTDSVAGKTAQIQSILETTTLSADQLASALDSVFSPKLNRAAANDAFIRSLQALKAQLKGTAGLTGSSTGALDNRAAVQSSVQALNAKLKADADAGASSARLTAELLRGRNAILAQGQAAGISRQDMAAYLRTLGLSPKLVRTLVRLDGADSASDKSGTLLTKLRQLTGIDAQPKVDVQAGNSIGLLSTIHNLVFGLDGKVANATVNVNYHARGAAAAAAAAGSARGNLFYARGDVANRHQPELTSPNTPIRVWSEPETKGEAYIPLANDDRRPRARDIAEQTVGLMGGSVMWFASGGNYDGSSYVPGATAASAALQLAQIRAQIAQINHDLKETHVVGKKGHKHRELVLPTGSTARAEKQAELVDARNQLTYLSNQGYYDGLAKAAQDAQDAADQATSDQQQAADAAAAQRKQDYDSAYAAAFGSGDIFGGGTSAASAVRYVQKAITQIQTFVTTVNSLRGSGASGLLIKQIVNHAISTGDFAGANRLGQSLLAQPLLLGQLNYELGTLDQLSSGLANNLADPGYLALGAGTQIPTSMSTAASGPQVVQVIVGASADQSVFQAQLVSAVAHEVKNQLNGAFS